MAVLTVWYWDLKPYLAASRQVVRTNLAATVESINGEDPYEVSVIIPIVDINQPGNIFKFITATVLTLGQELTVDLVSNGRSDFQVTNVRT